MRDDELDPVGENPIPLPRNRRATDDRPPAFFSFLQPSMKEFVSHTIMAILALFVFVLILNIRTSRAEIRNVHLDQQVNRYLLYENRASLWAAKAQVARLGLFYCQDAQTRGGPHDDCTRLEAFYQDAEVQAEKAKDRAAEVRRLLEFEGVDVP